LTRILKYDKGVRMKLALLAAFLLAGLSHTCLCIGNDENSPDHAASHCHTCSPLPQDCKKKNAEKRCGSKACVDLSVTATTARSLVSPVSLLADTACPVALVAVPATTVHASACRSRIHPPPWLELTPQLNP
jgi:hypothetical protein